MELYMTVRDEYFSDVVVGTYNERAGAEKATLHEKEDDPNGTYYLCKVIAVPRRGDVAKDKFYLEPAENMRKGKP